MNKRELIDKAIEEFGGVWHRNESTFNRLVYTPDCDEIFHIWTADWTNNGKWTELCTKRQFKRRASELGWINGYKYGVEYETNGKKPNLPDDVEIGCFDGLELNWWGLDGLKVGDLDFDTYVTQKFRIVDERYKPISEISENQQNVTVLSENNQKTENVSNWYEKGERPPVGVECEMLDADLIWRKVEILAYTKKGVVVEWDGKEFLQSKDREFRPLKSERERFVEAAWQMIYKEANITELGAKELAGKQYDVGFRAPK